MVTITSNLRVITTSFAKYTSRSHLQTFFIISRNEDSVTSQYSILLKKKYTKKTTKNPTTLLIRLPNQKHIVKRRKRDLHMQKLRQHLCYMLTTQTYQLLYCKGFICWLQVRCSTPDCTGSKNKSREILIENTVIQKKERWMRMSGGQSRMRITPHSSVRYFYDG